MFVSFKCDENHHNYSIWCHFQVRCITAPRRIDTSDPRFNPQHFAECLHSIEACETMRQVCFLRQKHGKKNTHSRWRKEKGEHDTMESILVCVRFLFNQSAHGFYWVEGKFIGLALAGPPLQPTFVKTTLARQRHRQIHFNRKPSKNCSAQTKTDTTSCFDRVPWRDRCQRRSPGLKGAAWGAAWGWRQPNTFLLDSRHSLTWSL